MKRELPHIYPGYIYPIEVREILGVSRNSVNALADQGKLEFIRVGKTDKQMGHRRFKLDSVMAFKNS